MRCFIVILLLPALPFQSCIAWSLKPFASTLTSTKRTSSTILTIANAPYISDVESWEGVHSKERRPTTYADAATDTDSSTYLIHKGRAVNMIKRCVAIEGLSMSNGWTPQATEAFTLAVEAVVRANPILTGQLVEEKTSPWPWTQQSTLRVIPGVFSPESH